MLGRKQAAIAASLLPTALGFGGASFLALLYITDWKVFVTKIPYYRGQFKDLPPSE